ncbi:E3 ubiquitin-protein ligase TRIM45-like [Diadema antillarum]|uniref:E3 ubiquitin-protein ligase TRIM45-like n=1 Tax=Diadema antillarum TaxID=105358 RepID=UPI003A87A843
MATIHQTIRHNLECPVCLTLFNQPKSLACSHTFCKDCLERISQTQTNQHTIPCPVCRKETSVPNGDVGNLQTIVALSSLVDEVETKSPTCTVCDKDEKPPAVSYCQDCMENMCLSCEKDHSVWKRFSNHVVVAMSEVVSGKVPHKRQRKCKEHPNEDEDCFCTGCRKYVCFKCGMLEHSKEEHEMVKASKHEKGLLQNIKELQKRANAKKVIIEGHIDFIETQRKEISDLMKKVNDDIDKTYEENMQLLSARRETLKCEVRQLSELFEKELHFMAERSHGTLNRMNAAEKLVASGMKVPLEKDALITHDTLCEKLKNILERNYPNDQVPRSVKERAQKISFRRHVTFNEPCLGELRCHTWDVKRSLHVNSLSVRCITRAPDNKMAVAGIPGILLYSHDGELQDRVLQDRRIYAIAFLSDGRSVISNNNKILLYTRQWEKLDVEFEPDNISGEYSANLSTDASDNIYVGFEWSKSIEVFTPHGGKSVRKIMCHGYSPWQLFSFKSTENMILTDRETVVCIDSEGREVHTMQKENKLAFPAVCRDDSVIVAWLNEEESLLSIDRYTSDLEHLHNLISDFRTSESDYYGLQEFESGEIAFCLDDELFIFHTT